MSNSNQIPTAFMYHLPKTEHQYLVDTLVKYNCKKYLVGHEKEPYPHYHLVAWLSPKEYINYNKHIVEKYKLRGSAKKGETKQYGKIKKIKDIERLMAYTCKDKDVLTTLNDQQLKLYFEMSYKKDNKKEFEQELDKYIKDYFKKSFHKQDYRNIDYKTDLGHTITSYSVELEKETSIKMIIIEYMVVKNIKFSKSSINSLYINYLRNNTDINNKETLHDSVKTIYHNLFGTPK